jgi:putative transposase
MALLDEPHSELSLKRQAELLSLNRSGLYYQAMPLSPEEVALKHRIDQIYTECPFYGSRRIAAVLHQEGRSIDYRAVRRHMREMGIQGICPGPNLSKRNLQHRIYPYLLRGVTIERPDHVWGIDITYLRLRHGWMYLVAILDGYSRYVISYELDQTLDIGFVLQAVRRALGDRQPEILNSDQGSHFTSEKYLTLLRDAQVRISMDGKGRALDNIFTERFWRSLKYENVYLHDYASPREARAGIVAYIDLYNHRRPHQSLQYRTPASVYHKEVIVHPTTSVLLSPEPVKG